MLDLNRPLMAPYSLDSFYDEMFGYDVPIRAHYEQVYRTFLTMAPAELAGKQLAMERRMLEEGITFAVYKPDQPDPLERTIPFDLIPRIIPRDEWTMLEKGLRQRVKALNRFTHDIYHEQLIVKEGIIPRRMIVANRYFRPEMMHVDVPGGTYITTSGIDLIRDAAGDYYVLEDNLRSPSGFSYLFKSRSIMNEIFPELTLSNTIRDVEISLNRFLTTLRSLSPSRKSNPVIALLTPGSFNSAYYEHAFLAQQMGIHLVEGRDLVTMDHKVYIRGLKGLQKVDVLYRRIDDDFLDPLAFKPDSVLGVAGIMNAYRAGNLAIVNAPGTGVADDKAVYCYVPDMIRFYLNEEPILRNVPTYVLDRPDEREYVLEHLRELVVKETSLSGGYGMLIGPAATEEELCAFAERIRLNPGLYIAQPTVQLSRAPVIQDGVMTPRHIDLRAFVLTGSREQMHVIPGGLTRVAMRPGSLVVNSSQGGGCKDTWVMA
ncbi:circularly permuted type 2 ATP-grasp protein [Paenibacillus koleovorans]|uniref:circularly permuted type 2 ATP-grasp protein n=1 Tax=Paenibacillus koleovorans TaxID=121608 RepID=UPI000FDB4DC1|nr:circularly permuted type 2 ATP-grasp protein [Paenibacillus koleovorans]